MPYAVVVSAAAVPLGCEPQLYHQLTPGASALKSLALRRS